MLQIKTKARMWLAIAAAISLASSPTVALATDFTPEGAAAWINIAQSLTVAIDSGNEHTSVCDGMNAFAAMRADFRREVTTTRVWALRAHVYACNALNNDGSAKGVKCKAYRMAVDQLTKVQPSLDPANVIAAAATLRESLDSIITEFNSAGLC
jgi:hypothetical protein